MKIILMLSFWLTGAALAPHSYAQTPPPAGSITQPHDAPQAPAANRPPSSTATNQPTSIAVSGKSDDKCFDSTCSMALQKALDTIAKGLQLKKLGSVDFAKFKGLNKLKSCANLPYTDTGEVYGAATAKGNLIYLTSLRGEISGSHVLFGTDCGSLVALNPIQIIIISYLIQGVPKQDATLPRRAFLPISPPGAKSEEKGQQGIQFKTEVGFVQINVDPIRGFADAQVSKDDGTLVFSEIYQLAEANK
jgi:hypothetical protein